MDHWKSLTLHATPLKSLSRISLNFMVKVDILCTYAYSQGIPIWYFFLGEHGSLLAKLYYFIQVLCTWIWMIGKLRVRSLPIFHFDFLSDCASLIMALAFIMCSTFKQCWSVGYVSLLTLSFIIQCFDKLLDNLS